MGGVTGGTPATLHRLSKKAAEGRDGAVYEVHSNEKMRTRTTSRITRRPSPSQPSRRPRSRRGHRAGRVNRGWGGHAKFDKTDPPLQPPALPVSGLSRSALLAKSHSREEARRSFHGEGVPVRLLAWVPLHPAGISYPDARSSDQFELHHDPVRLPGLTRARRLNRAGHFQGEGREAQRSATPSDGRDGR